LIENDIERHDVVVSALNGMEHFIHISMRAVEEAYLSEKQVIIESQKRDQDRVNKDAQLLVYNVSHDLKQPLTTVKGLISLLGEQYPQLLKGEPGTYMEHISKSTEWMEQLITGLLDYSKIGQTRQPEEVDLNVLVEDTLFEMYPWINSVNAKIEVERLPTLTVYPIEVKLLFQNLIGNALKYQKEGQAPEIRIRSELRGDKWLLLVEDNGIGIDPEYKDEIFILFRRLHGSNQFSGSGIGLAHCKKIVELHNGQIWVESTPGKGSTFFFTMSDVAIGAAGKIDVSSPVTDIKSGEHNRLNKLKKAL
jgi:light-regulated signal transduction histidine kinase (bacteriophytochrome)